MNLKNGLLNTARWVASPNHDSRPNDAQAEVIIIHSISLPPGEYGTHFVEDLFCNRLDPQQHPYFAGIHELTVSAHFLIQRTGDILQFVNTQQRAWHAGVSQCLGRDCVNDFSIGIELEGWDEATDGFTTAQYQALTELCQQLMQYYSIERKHIFGHSDIAPGRKNDPGPYFDWQQLFSEL